MNRTEFASSIRFLWITKLLTQRARMLLVTSSLLAGLILPVQGQAAELSSDVVDERIAQLNQQATPDAGLIEQYEQVRRRLDQIASFERQAAEYAEALTSAPKIEAEIQQRLDTFEDQYDPVADAAKIPQEELRERLLLARSERDKLAQEMDAMDRVLSARESNTAAIRARLNEIAAQLETADPNLPVDSSAEPMISEATAWLASAANLSLAAEARALTAELDSQPVRLNSMLAQRAELAINVERASQLITQLNERVAELPGHIARGISLGLDADDPAYSVVTQLLETHDELAMRRTELNESLAEIQQQQDLFNSRARTLEQRLTTTKRIVEYGGDSEVLGSVLYTYWVQIDELAMSEPVVSAVRNAGTIVIQRVEHEDTLAALVSVGSYVTSLLEDAGLEPESLDSDLREQLLESARAYREDLRDVIGLESKYLTALNDIQASRDTLDLEVKQYRDYMQNLVLWIPNHPPLWRIGWGTVGDELNLIAAEAREIDLTFSVPTTLALFTALLLLYSRPRQREFQEAMNERIARPRSDSIKYTLLALTAVALRAAPVPLMILAVAWMFETVQGAPDLGGLLLISAGLLFSFLLMKIISEPAGVGREHFAWQESTMDRVQSEIDLLIRWWLPLAVLAGIANALTPGLGEEAIGRLTTAIALLIVAIHFGRAIGRELAVQGSAWLQALLNKARLLFMLVLMLILFGTLSGQMFTVGVLFECVILSAWAGVGLLLTHAVLMRWLSVVRRRLRLNELLEQRAATSPGESGTMEEGWRIEDSAPGLGEISNDTRQLVNLLVAVASVTLGILIWEPLLPALSTLGEIQLWSTSTEIQGEAVLTQITLATVLSVLALAVVTLLAAKRLPALLEIVLRSRTTISSGLSYTISTLLNYLIISGGIVAALAALGLQWGQLQWLVAALGVGIGFGLQEIVANFISGLIILFERPIRIGDVVTVGDKDGTVTKIRIRATTIRDWDGKELLVPNKEFITGRLLNWSLSDSQTRLVIPVGIAYGSNVEKALAMLHDIVMEHPNTLDEPEPLIVFEHFGDNALELSARCFLDSLENRLRTMTELRTSINNAFADAGIVIAYPQRDIHLDASAPLRVTLEGPLGN